MGGCITFCFASLVGLDWLCRQSLPTGPHPVGTLNFMVAVNHINKAGNSFIQKGTGLPSGMRFQASGGALHLYQLHIFTQTLLCF